MTETVTFTLEELKTLFVEAYRQGKCDHDLTTGMRDAFEDVLMEATYDRGDSFDPDWCVDMADRLFGTRAVWNERFGTRGS